MTKKDPVYIRRNSRKPFGLENIEDRPVIHRVECIPDVKIENDRQALLSWALLCEHATQFAELTFSVSIQ